MATAEHVSERGLLNCSLVTFCFQRSNCVCVVCHHAAVHLLAVHQALPMVTVLHHQYHHDRGLSCFGEEFKINPLETMVTGGVSCGSIVPLAAQDRRSRHEVQSDTANKITFLGGFKEHLGI